MNDIQCGECDRITELTQEVKQTLYMIIQDNQKNDDSRLTQRQIDENQSQYSMEDEASVRRVTEEPDQDESIQEDSVEYIEQQSKVSKSDGRKRNIKNSKR